MKIQSMFSDDINRKINGVIKVDQKDATTEREVREYVITKELKKHFISFFNSYGEAFDKPTDDVGIWISGFFGSGKSHFLKMLSYLLANNEINGKKTVEYFREKFDDDPATFMLIDTATQHETKTILFNIDIEGPSVKDNTAVLRVFAKMFYTHLGFYGENLKVAMLEYYIEQMGKTEEFRRVFAEKKGDSWSNHRRAYAFNGKVLIPTLISVLGMSEEDANNWFYDKKPVEISIAQLVQDMNTYVSKKPKNFRLLFMVDEVGQYVGTDTSMLLNLQSLTEKIGSECGGKIWIACTGQEAIDEIIKVRENEFSRIQARFQTRLSLSSSSVDEVIQKRILKKTPEAVTELENVYNKSDSVLRNLFSFTDSVLDIKGYGGASEFVTNFPFVPYQFIIMQKVFSEIRKHGNSGKHLSGGERSMLSGFQEATQKIQEKNEYSLVPFFLFYDTVHGFLDGSIRRVIDRCEKAATDGNGIEVEDINVLKLLYLIRYIDDIKATVDNISILMADNIEVDKIQLRETVKTSLDRLINQNYIARSGDTYNFLTDEEQDIQKEISNTNVDTSNIVDKIAQIIYGTIYDSSKFRYGKYDFAFDKQVDTISLNTQTGGMKLKFLTIATDNVDKLESRMIADSKNSVVIILGETPYYELIEKSLKIRKFVRQKNVSQLPKSIQDIIRGQQDEAENYEQIAVDHLIKAINSGIFYADGEKIQVKNDTVKSKINEALEYLVSHVYHKLSLITKNADSDADIIAVLNGNADAGKIAGFEDNRDAATVIEEYLDIQARKLLPTSIADLQSRYHAIPYGWKEIDIACVIARLVYTQKVTIKYAGTTIQPNDKRLPDMLRKKSETGKTDISKRQVISATKINSVREFLREYFDIMDIPNDEDTIIAFIVKNFSEQKEYYTSLQNRYTGKNYPNKELVSRSLTLVESVLAQRNDNTSLLEYIIKSNDDLLDNKEDMQDIELFFKNQVTLFDEATTLEKSLENEHFYFKEEVEIKKALADINTIISQQTPKFNYKKIPELNALIASVRDAHSRLLDVKRKEIMEVIRQCMETIHAYKESSDEIRNIILKADDLYSKIKIHVANLENLTLLDGQLPHILDCKEKACTDIEDLLKPVESKSTSQTSPPVSSPKNIKTINRQVVFPSRKLENEADIDAYVEKIRKQLKEQLKNYDGIELK